ncbi:MAG: arginine deiminase-related protein [Acidimicrobiales bacterium]
MRLTWGRHFLLCPPDHFEVAYEINPYMHKQVHPNPERAGGQFEVLAKNLQSAGATVEMMDPVAGLPDLVFTANAGVVDGNRFIPARFRHPERQGETPFDEAWFEGRGFELEQLRGDEPFEGAGDALPFGLSTENLHPVMVAGYKTRSSVGTHTDLSEALGIPVRSVELIDQRYYHLDLVFCPLGPRHALIAPQGLDRFGIKVLEELVPEPIWLEDDEAETFSANSVVVNDAIVMPACTTRLGRILEGIGLEVIVSPVDEFLKAGGGCRCLTLALDVRFGAKGG